jgi:hypothetical protein
MQINNMLINRLFKPSYSTKFVRFYSASTQGGINSELSDLTQSIKSLNTRARRALFYGKLFYLFYKLIINF